MTVKTIMHLMKLFNYKQIKLDEETRKKLSDVDIIYLQDIKDLDLFLLRFVSKLTPGNFNSGIFYFWSFY